MAQYQSRSFKRRFTNHHRAAFYDDFPSRRPRYNNRYDNHIQYPSQRAPYERYSSPHRQLAPREPRPGPRISKIDKLPRELLLDIAAWTKLSLSETDPSFFPQATNTFYRTGEIPIYKILRQVSKRWNSLYSPALFDTLTICEYPESWANVNKIANCEPLKNYIKAIKYVTTPGFPKLADVNEWCWKITSGYRHDEEQKLYYVDPNDQIRALVGFRRTIPVPLLEIKSFLSLGLLEIPEKVLWLWSQEPHVLGVASSRSLLGLFEEIKGERMKGEIVDVKAEQKEEVAG